MRVASHLRTLSGHCNLKYEIDKFGLALFGHVQIQI